MISNPLIQPLTTDLVDIIGDVHGEIDALRRLMRRLGYRNGGVHPEGRKLVFVGDLTDRGPNSPAVIRLVTRLFDEGLALGVLGNHDLNLLLSQHKHGNHWFFGEPESLDRKDPTITPQALANERMRCCTLRLFRRFPLVLHNHKVRIVHAGWNEWAIERVRQADCADVVTLFQRWQDEADAAVNRLARGEIGPQELLQMHSLDLERGQALFLTRAGSSEELRTAMLDPTGRELARQNFNPIKLLTSGPEKRLDTPIDTGGKIRYEGRLSWWTEYRDTPIVAFGHYSRRALPWDGPRDTVFDDERPQRGLGNGRAVCVDFSVTRRWEERRRKVPFRTALAALRLPEERLYFDNAETVQLESP